MTDRTMSLMDVLAPPGNDWLRELSRRKSDLPAGVRVVRFSDSDDDSVEDTEAAGMTTRSRKHATA